MVRYARYSQMPAGAWRGLEFSRAEIACWGAPTVKAAPTRHDARRPVRARGAAKVAPA